MQFITFCSLRGKNFLSIGDVEFLADLKPGVNAIVGTNYDKEDSKNGAGKSTITELLYFALYGSTLRDISKDNIQNSITKKRCEVSLEFSVTTNNRTDIYKIVRKLNPTKCQLFKNGEDVTRSTLAKTNAYIQDLIRTPSAVFKNSVIMSANDALPFMALSKTDKRKFVESVLGLEIFTQMVLKARDDYSVSKKDYEIAYSKYEHLMTELEFNKVQLETYESTKQERLNKLHGKKDNILQDIDNLKAQISSTSCSSPDVYNEQISSAQKKLEELLNKRDSLNAKKIKLQTEINAEQKCIKNLQNNKDSCPTCSREYSDEHIKHIQNLIEKHDDNIKKFVDAERTIASHLETNEQSVLLVKNELKQLQEGQRESEQRQNNDQRLLSSISFLEKNLLDISTEIKILKSEQNNELKGKVSSLAESIKVLKSSVDSLNNELNVLETVKFVISEEGIKSFIVKKILKVLNSRLAFYLKKLEANCLCQFNEFFDEEIVDESSNSKSYFNFSGGERKRIDLACLFAFADIRRLQGDVNFSTVFYDELLDSSLDDKGVQLTLRVLRERFNENNESCYVITHRGPEVTTKAEHVIHVIKKNGVTVLASGQK